LIFGCKQNEVPEEVEMELSEMDELAHDFAKLLATSMNEKPIRDFIKAEASNKFDGDYDILFAMTRDKEIEMSNGRGGKMTFAEALIGNGSNARMELSEYDVLLTQLEMEYPTMQIAVPQLDEYSVENWDTTNETPLVVVLPEDYDELTHDFVTGYDEFGNMHQVSTLVEPAELMVVVSPSERVLAFEISENTRSDYSLECFLGDPIMTTQSYEIYMIDDVTTECGGSADLIQPTTTPNCTEVELVSLKFDAYSLKHVEKWVSGAPEIRLWRYTSRNGQFVGVHKFGQMEPRYRRDIVDRWWKVNSGNGKNVFSYSDGIAFALWFWEYDPIGGLGTLTDPSICPNPCALEHCGRRNGLQYPLPNMENNCVARRHDELGSRIISSYHTGTCGELSHYHRSIGGGTFSYRLEME